MNPGRSPITLDDAERHLAAVTALPERRKREILRPGELRRRYGEPERPVRLQLHLAARAGVDAREKSTAETSHVRESIPPMPAFPSKGSFTDPATLMIAP